MIKLRSSIPVLIVAVLLAGCASPEKSASDQPQPETKKEYVRQTPTGSWIPRKVPKSQTSETDTAEAQQAMGDLQRRANQTPKESGG